jgi:hypothetical protein
MNYQSIRAQVENPLLTAFGALSPAVPVYFDNITAAPENSTTEYVRVNVTFGLTNDPTLTSSIDNARGAIVIRCFSKKGEGLSRNQTLITTAVDVLETLNNGTKGTTGTYLKVGSIDGPSFSSDEDAPLFMGRIETSYVATVLS